MLYIKALHIIFVVTWFAGLFYIVRLFIYHTEAEQRSEPKKSILQSQFRLMEKRLWYGITWPSAVLTMIFGIWLITKMGLWSAPYMHLKLTFVFFLYLYHFSCQHIYNKLKQNNVKYSPTQLRIWNEVATLFLVAIVFIIVVKSMNWIYGLIGLVLFAVMLMLAIRVYKRLRTKNND